MHMFGDTNVSLGEGCSTFLDWFFFLLCIQATKTSGIFPLSTKDMTAAFEKMTVVSATWAKEFCNILFVSNWGFVSS